MKVLGVCFFKHTSTQSPKLKKQKHGFYQTVYAYRRLDPTLTQELRKIYRGYTSYQSHISPTLVRGLLVYTNVYSVTYSSFNTQADI